MTAWVRIFAVRGRVFAVVDDLVDERLGEDDGLNFPTEGFLKDVVLWEVDCLVGIVGGVEFWLAREEHVVGDAG